jgi:diguanylate cyclase (GGDEF)-like protein
VDSFETNVIGTAVQVTGAGLIGILCYLLGRTIRHPFLRYWSAGWACLTVALFALLVSFLNPATLPVTLRVYCGFEYGAGILFAAGCLHFTRDRLLTPRHLWLALPAGLLAVVLPGVAPNLDALLAVHMLVVAGLFATACAVLVTAPEKRARGTGPAVMAFALALLTAEFLQYVPLCGYSYWTGDPFAFPHLRYAVFFDLLLEVLLGFGMEMVALECVRRELEAANRELRRAGSRLRDQAQRDPLTGALNRFAFDALRAERAGGPDCCGCVAVLDLDNLKPINDTLGHAAGDLALQLTARAIRSLIRPDDLLFRWGGDEFLILWLGMREADATARLAGVNEALARQAAEASAPFPREPSVSFGLAGFAAAGELDVAIERADQRMYAAKAARRGRGGPQPVAARG